MSSINHTGIVLITGKSHPILVAGLQKAGYASDDKIKEKSQELQNLISREKLTKVGTFQYLGYNPPWKVIGRKNEIAVEIN